MSTGRSDTGRGVVLHASTVDIDGSGVLITGASGTGKSALALELMARRARLVADDRTHLDVRSGQLIASCPRQIAGMIEARGVGLLRADAVETSQIMLAIDLDQTETERLPARRQVTIAGVSVPLLCKIAAPHFAAAILQYIRGGYIEAP